MAKSKANLKRVFHVIEHLNKYTERGDVDKANVCLKELSEILDEKAEKVQDEYWKFRNDLTSLQVNTSK